MPLCEPLLGNQKKLKTEAPYSPLSTLEVEAAGMPPPSEPDAYLQARIDHFYAELQVPCPATVTSPGRMSPIFGA